MDTIVHLDTIVGTDSDGRHYGISAKRLEVYIPIEYSMIFNLEMVYQYVIYMIWNALGLWACFTLEVFSSYQGHKSKRLTGCILTTKEYIYTV